MQCSRLMKWRAVLEKDKQNWQTINYLSKEYSNIKNKYEKGNNTIVTTKIQRIIRCYY
jgi:hypothetical protein